MSDLIAYAQTLVRQAKAVSDAHGTDERKQLPVSERPDTGLRFEGYPTDFCDEFNDAVATLFKITRDVRDKGFSHVKATTGEYIETHSPQDMDNAITKVESLLERAS